MTKQKFSERMERFNEWRTAHLTNQQFMLLLSVPTGFLGGLAAILIKKSAHGIRDLVLSIHFEHSDILYFVFPAIGILLTICFCKFILRKEIGHGIPGILYAIKKKNNHDQGQRQFCGCMVSKDIGEYNTCPHLCEYCYANTSKEIAVNNYKQAEKTQWISETITGR